MPAPGPRTTWEELASLGWSRQAAYNVLNARRGGTMEGLEDMALNEGFALDFGWLSHNVLVGQPRIASQSADHIQSSTIVRTLDNSQNTDDLTLDWNETWTNTASAALSVSNRAGVSLNQSISIMDVAGSGFSISISTESTTEETQTNSRQFSTTVSTMAGETVHLERIRTIRQGQATYDQDYGLAPDSLIGTKGRIWEDHVYWGFNINATLNTPRGTMALRGRSSDETFTFRIVRVGRDGRRTVEPVPPPEGKNPIVRMSEECGTKFPHMIPGLEKAGN
ncbi:cytolysin [Mycena leptocephala]|nr:cytolysin [Mycena leptocephala]